MLRNWFRFIIIFVEWKRNEYINTTKIFVRLLWNRKKCNVAKNRSLYFKGRGTLTKMRKKRKKSIVSWVLCILLLCSCISYNGEEGYVSAKSVNDSNETVIPETTSTSEITATLEVTATPKVTATAELTATPEVTATAELTATLEVTATVELTATPEVTITPNATPTATALPTPTAYPEPTQPETTSTPAASRIPEVTPTIPDNIVQKTHINYVLNGGVNSKKNPYYLKKGKQSKLYGATKKGYYFVGWYTRPDFKTRVTSVKANGQKTITFYARWKKVSVKKSKIVSAELIKNNRIRVKVKVQNGVNGYEYIYSTTPSFAKKSIVRSKRNPKDLSRLKGKKYYIKVRSYKIDSCGNKVYGPYSTIVYCKCS